VSQRSLSVCCLVADPPARVAASLALLRPVTDELVVAADSASAAAESQELAELADRFYRVDFTLPFERYLSWLHSVCSGDWILRIDGDEVVGTSLVDAIPELVSERKVHQYRIPRRWLFPDAGRWLDEPPWQPDYQIRLVRNDPATLRFAGLQHTSAEPVLPARFLVEPIYHLKLIVKTIEERERDARAYEQLEGGWQADNERFYLPERQPNASSLAETPNTDRARIEAILSAQESLRKQHASSVAVALTEIDRHWSRRQFDPMGYQVELRFLQDRLRAAPGEERDIPLLVRNRGTETLPFAAGPPNIRASYHWLTSSGATVEADGVRTAFPSAISSGDEAVVPLRVISPQDPGEYVLEADLVHEDVRWFGCGTRLPVTVSAPLPRSTSSSATNSSGSSTIGRVVCVTGMHRSGTSVVTRLLVELGLYVGEDKDLLAPAPDNRDGYWERQDIVELNDELLRMLGGSAIEPPLLEPGWEQSTALDPLRERATALLGSWTAGQQLVGWKDPRTSLTLPFWRTVHPVHATVLALRNPLEVARSLESRNGFDAHIAARLYVAYVVSALDNDPECTVVTYESLFSDLDVVIDQLAESLCVTRPPTAALSPLVKTSLRASRLDEITSDGSLGVALAVYSLLSTGQRKLVLALREVLLDWAVEARRDSRLLALQHEVAAANAREVEATARETELANRRSVRVAITVARALERLRRV
jgi:hypothetical protein